MTADKTASATDPGYIDNKADLLNRMRRISGQVGGVERMVDQERYCIDILTQISAVQAALDKVAVGLLADHTRHCVVGASEANREEKTEEMMAAVSRLIKTR
jgi:CsoR family transcriptional regulator, copper-sensing transcriptional repressor